ncbi:MAG TPA: hypothetical protein VK817_02955 [Trebonia sp.]|nr:hypothetical protein [Trebonia sp.]
MIRASGQAHQNYLAWWLTLFAVYAVIMAIVTRGPSQVWGAWAAAGYAVAALTAWRWRGSALPLLIGVCGAVAAPTIWLSIGWQPGEEPVVVARAAFLLLHHGSPYLASGQLVSAQSYNPYLPAMSVFGLPYMARLPGILGNPESWMAVTTLVLTAVAIRVALPHLSWRRAAEARPLLRKTALALVTPVLALPIALGTTDPPVIALICVALACASRSVAGGAEAARESATVRWITWNGLAALAIGIACAMKATAWPAVPVIAAMLASRIGIRAAVRFAGAAIATAAILTIAFAPVLVTQPGAFFDNIIAYPLGLAHHLTPAASPLPGHLLADTGTPGRMAALGLLLVGALGIAASLVRRPPRDILAATVYIALGLTLLFTLAPNSRFGYFAYPAALIGWFALTGRPRAARTGEPWPKRAHNPSQGSPARL